MNSNKVIIITSIVFLAIVIWMFLSDYTPPTETNPTTLPEVSVADQQIKKNLVEEFNSAYPQESTPNGTVKEINFIAAPSRVMVAGKEIDTWAYNNQVPGPQVRIKLGDTVKITLKNQLPQPTTIHWHGVRIPNDMDGVPDITQRPIQPGETFTYEFTPKDAGTFWYHPHVRGSEQLERGLYGALTVEDPNEPAYTQDLVWVIDDWRLGQNGEIAESFNNPHDVMMNGRWGNVITVNSDVHPQVNVQPGERIRLRLVNSSNARVYRPRFNNVQATVIAVDGMLVAEPFSLSSFDIAPGNRLDLDITIPESLANSSIEVTDTFTQDTLKLGSLSVGAQLVFTPQFNSPHAALIPVWSQATGLPVEHEFILDASAGQSAGHNSMGHMMSMQWKIDGYAYPKYGKVQLHRGEFYKLSYFNDSNRLHPMHLHGQFFKVITRNGKPANENFFRDTLLLYPNERVEIGIIPLDKGQWAHHCHIQEHAEAGMMTITEVI